jgi:hypothetical protein
MGTLKDRLGDMIQSSILDQTHSWKASIKARNRNRRDTESQLKNNVRSTARLLACVKDQAGLPTDHLVGCEESHLKLIINEAQSSWAMVSSSTMYNHPSQVLWDMFNPLLSGAPPLPVAITHDYVSSFRIECASLKYGGILHEIDM